MNEYISKKYLEELLDYYLNNSNGAERYGYSIIKGEIEHAPITYVKEAVHGEWEIVDFAGNMQCSVCGKIGAKLNYESDYCPNCGAKMDEH